MSPVAVCRFGLFALAIAAHIAPATAQKPAQPAVGTSPPSATAAESAAPGTLGVATLKLENGWRASHLIGSTVYNAQNEEVGTVDDLILTQQDKVVVAIISVGGFLGIGSKLVAVPYSELRLDHDRTLLGTASKDALNSMPAFTYGG